MSDQTQTSSKLVLTSTGFDVLRTFKIILDAWPQGRAYDNVEYDAVLHQEERYDLWAINIGLYQSGHGSLDYRFRDAPALLSHCEKLLSNLRELLRSLSSELPDRQSGPEEDAGLDSDLDSEPTDEIFDGYDEDFENDEYDDQSVAQAILDGITDCVNRLYQLSMKVQAASRRIGSSRGYSYQRIDDESGLDFFDRFTQLGIDEAHITELLVSLRKGNEASLSGDQALIARLAKANNQRRRQFGYWSQHKINLVRRSEAAKDRLMLGQPMPTPSQASKPTTATQVNPGAININDDNQSATSAISIDVSAIKDSDEELDIPGPPEKYLAQNDLKEFECPYCFTACSARFLNVRKWRAHLLRDLRPYTCIVEACKNTSQLYDSFSDWANHDIQHKPELLNIPAANSDSNTLSRPTDSSTQIPANQAGKTRKCPFCLQLMTDLGTFYKHVAHHLVRVALFSLPRSTGVEEDDDGGSAISDLAVPTNGDWFSSSGIASLSSDTVSDENTPEQFESSNKQASDSRADGGPTVSPSHETSTGPRGRIRILNDLLDRTYQIQATQFLQSQWLDKLEKEKKYRSLNEGIFKYIMVAADAVELEGDPVARAERKVLLQRATNLLESLDAFMKLRADSTTAKVDTELDVLGAEVDQRLPRSAKEHQKSERDEIMRREIGSEVQEDTQSGQKHRLTYPACKACRERKVKCVMDPVNQPHGPPCARCRRENKQCIFVHHRSKSPIHSSSSDSIRDGREGVSRRAPVTQSSGTDTEPSAIMDPYLIIREDQFGKAWKKEDEMAVERASRSRQDATSDNEDENEGIWMQRRGSLRERKYLIAGEAEAVGDLPEQEEEQKRKEKENAEFEQKVRERALQAGWTDEYVEDPVAGMNDKQPEERRQLPPSTLEESEEEEFKEKLGERYHKAGFPEEDVEEPLTNTQEKQPHDRGRSPPSNAEGSDPMNTSEQQDTWDSERPTWIRIARKHILPETLDTYDLPWVYEEDNDDYIIVKEYVDRDLQNRLFDHTRKIRESRRHLDGGRSSPSKDKRSQSMDTSEQPDISERPTWTRVARKHLLPKTLDVYNLKWEYDPEDGDYLIIKEYVNRDLQQVLFEHTKKIRQSHKAD